MGDARRLRRGVVLHTFKQEMPIATYLLALVDGAVVPRRLGPRSQVWSEESMVEACAWEFSDVGKVLVNTGAHQLHGNFSPFAVPVAQMHACAARTCH